MSHRTRELDGIGRFGRQEMMASGAARCSIASRRFIVVTPALRCDSMFYRRVDTMSPHHTKAIF